MTTTFTKIRSADFSGYENGNYSKITGVATNADGSIIYTCLYEVENGVLKSTDFGATWNTFVPATTSLTSITCTPDGNILYLVAESVLLYTTKNGTSGSGTFVTFTNPALPGGSANPESQFTPTRTLQDMCQIACDSLGENLIMTTRLGAAIYRSTNSGADWSFIHKINGYNNSPSSTKRPTYLASNSDGSILYAATNEDTYDVNNQIATTVSNIIRGTKVGDNWNWNYIDMGAITGPFSSLGTNLTGDFVFATKGTNLYIFYPTHTDKSILELSDVLGPLAVYNNGSGIIIVQDESDSITGGAVVVYSLANKYSTGPIPCFKEDSKILCFKDGEEVYLKIQDIRSGDLVKTLKNGYVPVYMIGKKDIYHPAKEERNNQQLYKCSCEQYPELFEDLIITGCHSILVYRFIDSVQRQNVIGAIGKIYSTDGRLRLPACADLRASVYEESGTYCIYHLALKNDDRLGNYGIWANGLLVESCSKRYLEELSGMQITRLE